jgi:hypothetical protein
MSWRASDLAAYIVNHSVFRYFNVVSNSAVTPSKGVIACAGRKEKMV